MVQVNNAPIILRIKFLKTGNLQYISHLDLVRTVNKIIVRAGFPLRYTEGFNPKPKMVFAAPLSIGTESLTEFLDVRLSERMDCDEAVRLFNANSTEELRAVSAYYPETKLTDMKWLRYLMEIRTNNATEELATECERVLLADRVEIEKKTKSKDIVLTDIRGQIRSVSAVLDGDVIRIDAVLSADSSAFLNPEYIIKVLRAKLGILSSSRLTEEYYSILRTEAFCEDMTPFL